MSDWLYKTFEAREARLRELTQMVNAAREENVLAQARHEQVMHALRSLTPTLPPAPSPSPSPSPPPPPSPHSQEQQAASIESGSSENVRESQDAPSPSSTHSPPSQEQQATSMESGSSGRARESHGEQEPLETPPQKSTQHVAGESPANMQGRDQTIVRDDEVVGGMDDFDAAPARQYDEPELPIEPAAYETADDSHREPTSAELSARVNNQFSDGLNALGLEDDDDDDDDLSSVAENLDSDHPPMSPTKKRRVMKGKGVSTASLDEREDLPTKVRRSNRTSTAESPFSAGSSSAFRRLSSGNPSADSATVGSSKARGMGEANEVSSLFRKPEAGKLLNVIDAEAIRVVRDPDDTRRQSFSDLKSVEKEALRAQWEAWKRKDRLIAFPKANKPSQCLGHHLGRFGESKWMPSGAWEACADCI